MTTHVVAASGLRYWSGNRFTGEISPSDEPSPLAQFIIGLTGVTKPRMLYIGTATGDEQRLIDLWTESVTRWGFEPSHLPLFTSFDLSTLDEFVSSQNLIWVQGGNTASMLAVWRRLGVDQAVKNAFNNGTVMCGTSAGGLCWWEHGSTDSFGHPVQPIHDTLGWIPGSFCPHYDSEADRRPLLHGWVSNQDLPATYAVDDGVGIYMRDGQLDEAISEREGSSAYYVARADDGAAVETVIPTRLLD